MSSGVVVYGPSYSNFVRCVALCCLEKGVTYELHPAEQQAGRLNPFHKVPVMERDGLVLYETAAICRYLDRAFVGPPLSPTDPAELGWMDQWISAAVCYFDSAIIRRYVLEYAFPKGDDGAVREDVVSQAGRDIEKHLEIMSSALSRYDYFSGHSVGIADYLIMPMLDYLANGVVPTRLIDEYPVVNEYFQRMWERASCRKVLGRP